MTGRPELRLLALYPEQMNIYADRGNILFLARRCEWRGIGFRHSAAGPGDGFDPSEHDLIYVGGGQDRPARALDLPHTDLLDRMPLYTLARQQDGIIGD